MSTAPFASARARDRAARRTLLPVLLDRLDRLSPTERDLLREYVNAELADADEIDSMRRGLDKHRQEQQQRITAADKAIVEIEQDRDAAREQLDQVEHRARASEAALGHVQATLDAIDRDRARLSPENESFGDGYADAVARIRTALDDQPKELTP